ncbi:MAG: DUF349 domain-containing protein [Propionibacteriaceae bacterium]|jgi:hypothetical protein|nr:DUF349 domain-containing protein [Propionibacteriaceae bacterium]
MTIAAASPETDPQAGEVVPDRPEAAEAGVEAVAAESVSAESGAGESGAGDAESVVDVAVPGESVSGESGTVIDVAVDGGAESVDGGLVPGGVDVAVSGGAEAVDGGPVSGGVGVDEVEGDVAGSDDSVADESGVGDVEAVSGGAEAVDGGPVSGGVEVDEVEGDVAEFGDSVVDESVVDESGAEVGGGGSEEAGDDGAEARPVPGPRQLERAAAQATKESLIAQAMVLALTGEAATARGEMGRLLGEWRRSGRAAADQDEALWARFKAAQKILDTRLELEWRQRRSREAAARQVKEGLCATAERLAERLDLKQASETMRSLQAQWRQAGRAQGEAELWQRFQAAQRRLFARVDQERQQVTAAQTEATQAKRQIVDQIQALVGVADLSWARAEAARLSDAFHAGGYAGPAKERRLAGQLQQAQRDFYRWAKEEPARRRGSGQQPLYTRRVRLEQQAQRLEQDVARVQAALDLAPEGSAGRRQHGSGLTLSLTGGGPGSALAAELMRLRLSLEETRREIQSLDQRLDQTPDQDRPEPDGDRPRSGGDRSRSGGDRLGESRSRSGGGRSSGDDHPAEKRSRPGSGKGRSRPVKGRSGGGSSGSGEGQAGPDEGRSGPDGKRSEPVVEPPELEGVSPEMGGEPPELDGVSSELDGVSSGSDDGSSGSDEG